MKIRITKLGAMGLALLWLQTIALAQNANQSAQSAQSGASKRLHTWWRDAAPGLRSYTAGNKQMPLISVKGNKFVDSNGKTVFFRGLAISDPDKLEMQGHWSKDLFVKVKEMGANLVRIPVHPVAWRERTPAEYIKLLDQAVDWCTELGMYIIIDWHSIGNLQTEVFQDPMYKMMFDRLVKYHKIRNLIWIWNCDRPEGTSLKFEECWPGPEYADILALDCYSTFKQSYYDDMVKLADGKPIALGEVGGNLNLAAIKSQPKWVFWMEWAGSGVRRDVARNLAEMVKEPRYWSLSDPEYRTAIAPIRTASGLPAEPPAP